MRTIPLLTPEEIALRAGQQTSPWILPPRDVFASRAARMRQLADGHPLHDYLRLIADLCDAQHALLQAHPPVTLPTPEAIDEDARETRAPLAAWTWARDGSWLLGLDRIVEHLAPGLTGTPRDIADGLRESSADDIEWLADRLLNGLDVGEAIGATPFVFAALQVHWTHLLLETEARHPGLHTALLRATAEPTRCPACGSRPVAAVTRIDPGAGGLRYLSCGLCSLQWHMVRVKCSRCEGTKGIRYHALAPAHGTPTDDAPAVEAETCDECGAYLKIVRMDRDPQVEPLADDLANVALDLLVSQQGYHRHGCNVMLLLGDAEPAG